eukprot:m.102835 g.102835  ORF g.102835 m.102835 type:complete len:100 (+) comp37185_c0_seq13:800-1099(+)
MVGISCLVAGVGEIDVCSYSLPAYLFVEICSLTIFNLVLCNGYQLHPHKCQFASDEGCKFLVEASLAVSLLVPIRLALAYRPCANEGPVFYFFWHLIGS